MSSRPLYISLLLFAIYSLILLTLSFINYSIIKTVLLWIAGLLLFTFVEYLFHRFFFHMEPKGPVKNKVQYAIHGNHHAKPNEATTIMMKPLIAITAIVFTTLLFYGLFGLYVLAVLPGFLTGYCAYLFIHFAIHTYKPPKSFLRLLWRQHNLHHYNDDSKNFGVSSPLWDVIFKTYCGSKTNKQKTETVL